mmetsp:Transcript_12212/g.42875  ORF Transcript_12212/g.42875 Transcript_12212/m.42875 type:complete len:200 (-) Transcript_12212:1349-1948(-)
MDVEHAQDGVEGVAVAVQDCGGETLARFARDVAVRRGEGERRCRHDAALVDQRALQLLAVQLNHRGARREGTNRAFGSHQRLRRHRQLLADSVVGIRPGGCEAGLDALLHRQQDARHRCQRLAEPCRGHVVDRLEVGAVGAVEHTPQVALGGPRRRDLVAVLVNDARSGLLVVRFRQQELGSLGADADHAHHLAPDDAL